MPALCASGYVTACLQASSLCRFVLPCIRLLRWFRLGCLFIWLGSRLVQRTFSRYFLGFFGRLGERRSSGWLRLFGWYFRFLGGFAFALLFLGCFCSLTGNQFCLLARFFFSERGLLRIDVWRVWRRSRCRGHWRSREIYILNTGFGGFRR